MLYVDIRHIVPLMYIHLTDDERISLTLKEIAILIALTPSPASGYNIAKICAAAAQQTTPMSRGGLYPALKRLELASLILRTEPNTRVKNPGKPKIVYQLTSRGELVLGWHIETLRRLTALANQT